MDYSSSLGEDKIRRIGRVVPVSQASISASISANIPAITPAIERQRLIKALVHERDRHFEEALRDIEAR